MFAFARDLPNDVVALPVLLLEALRPLGFFGCKTLSLSDSIAEKF